MSLSQRGDEGAETHPSLWSWRSLRATSGWRNFQSNSSFGNLAPLFGSITVPSISAEYPGQLARGKETHESVPKAATLLLPTGSSQTKCPHPFPLAERFSSHLYLFVGCCEGARNIGWTLAEVEGVEEREEVDEALVRGRLDEEAAGARRGGQQLLLKITGRAAHRLPSLLSEQE